MSKTTGEVEPYPPISCYEMVGPPKYRLYLQLSLMRLSRPSKIHHYLVTSLRKIRAQIMWKEVQANINLRFNPNHKAYTVRSYLHKHNDIMDSPPPPGQIP